jgi:hypothetical protein
MSEWAGRTEQDHLMYVLRDSCHAKGASNKISDYGVGGPMTYAEGLSTDIIQEAKQALISQGGQPMNTGADGNQEIPGYLFFAPDACLRPLRSDPDYLEAITQADSRGPENKLYSGSYAKWDNNVIANHNTLIDTADGRQGSPLLPTLLLDTSANGNGSGNIDGNAGTIVGAGDAFANFDGANVRIPGGGGGLMPGANTGFHMAAGAAAQDNAEDTYVLVIDAVAKTVAHFSVTSISDDLATLTIKADLTAGGSIPVAAQHVPAGTVYTFADGSLICQANLIGTPIGYALAMGEGALYYAKGSVSNEQIFHYDDFANSGNDAHLNAIGLQSIYGFGAYQDTRSRVPGVQLVECVRQVPGLSLAN